MSFIRKIQIIVILVFLTYNSLFARIFFVGSNPHITIFAFPQDIFLTNGDFVYYYTTYQKDPWWGDIDQPTLRPNKTYISTGEDIDGGANGSTFKHKALINLFKNHIGFGREISNTARTRFDLRYSLWSMRNSASGSFVADSADDVAVTFDYAEKHSIQDIQFRSTLALMIRDIPVGFKVELGSQGGSKSVLGGHFPLQKVDFSNFFPFGRR